jgi:hypothetical protein
MRKSRGFVIVACVVLLWPLTAGAQAMICTKSYESAQEERMAGHLNAALVQLRKCVDPTCPKFIREDCARWLDETETALPSVVFAVRRDGKDLTDVEVLCDSEPLARSLDGKAIPLDPGVHTFTFNVPSSASVELQVLIRSGERSRIIEVELDRPRSVAPIGTAGLSVDGAPTKSVTRYVPYALTGVGIIGLAGFTTFAVLGNSQKSDLERTCSPYCRASQVDSVKTKYLLADTFLGVGVVSLGVATYLFVRRHGDARSDGASHATSITFAPQTSGEGGVAQVSGRF